MKDETERRTGLPLGIVAIFVVPFLIALIAFISFRFFGANKIENEVIVRGAKGVSAMAPLPAGGFVFGERTSGQIFRSDPSGAVEEEPLALVEVTTGNGSGLLGLAADGSGRVFASYTDRESFMTVAAVEEDGVLRKVWKGPQTEAAGNGGTIAFSPGGDLVVAIGDLGEPDLISDPSQPNGKLLSLDPDGSSSQTAQIISGGWNEPSAFTFAPAGALWVADAGSGEAADRIARGDIAGSPEDIALLRDETDPTGLVAPDDDTLVLCGSANRELSVMKIDARGIAYTLERFPTLATDCLLGVIALRDGRLVYSTGDDLKVAPAP